MSLFNKFATLAKATTHDILNKAIDLNSPAMIRQYTRDLEDAIGKMQGELASQSGQLRTLQREQNDLDASIANDTATVSALLKSTNPDAGNIAKKKAVIIIANKQRLVDHANAVSSQQQAVDSLKGAVDALTGKHQQMVDRVRELERLDRDTKAKESAAAAINAAGTIVGNVDSVSVDDVAERMRRRNDAAGASFDQAMGGFHVSDSSGVDSADVDALLASLQPKEEAVAQ